VVETRFYARNIPHAIAVGVAKRTRIYLVDDAVLPPRCGHAGT